MRFATTLLLLMTVTATTYAQDSRLDKLTEGQSLNGFRVAAVYLNDADKPMGARFVHRQSGFTLDLLQIESVPQGYTWVNSIPVSDQGEPHTQEHLLLGKGTTGRAFASLDTMWLASSSAFTQQWRTSYHFNTSAGADVFFNIFAAQMNAMLNPNYTDEEIRREVRNFGVTQAADGSLRLEEKGSVYNEMISSMGSPYRPLFRAAGQLVYGKDHPLAMNSGGEPSGIRTMKPEDIRNFHKANYYLANMGLIASFPRSVGLTSILGRVDSILDRLQPKQETRKAASLDDLPQPKAGPAGTIAYGEYPHRNDQQPSPIMMMWPATRKLDTNEKVLADLFFANIAGDATTNLYKLFIDSKTRRLDIGAKQIFSNVSDDTGNPIYIALTDVNPTNFTDGQMSAIRAIVVEEIRRIVSLPDGSPELKEFNARISSRVVELQRDLAKFVNSPPGFGFRNANSGWMDHLMALEKTPEFRKSVTLKPQIAFIQGVASSDKNVWREYLSKWQITGVSPYALASRPSPALIQREENERIGRANAEAARLAQSYGVSDQQEAIKRYRTEYDAASLKIEEEAKSIKSPQFVKSPPMTLDDQLQYDTKTVGAKVPIVSSRFDNMTSGMIGIAFNVDDVPANRLRYVSLMPALLTRVGVIDNGRPIPYEEMTDRLRNEILSLDANFSTNMRTERVELVARGAGIGADETRRAIDWMALVLFSPDWRPENLSRIRDVVDQELSRLRNTMQGSEESWVNSPANAYRMQRNPWFLATDSFLTRAHNALRLKWQLRQMNAADTEPVARFFRDLATNGTKSRADLKKYLAGAPPDYLSPGARTLAGDLMKDLDQTLIEMPDGSLGSDWAYLVAALHSDLLTPPAETLKMLDSVRKQVVNAANARMFQVGSTTMEKAIAPQVTAFASKLEPGGATAVPAVEARRIPLVDSRLAARDASAKSPLHVGLLAPNMKGGVIITSVPAVHYSDFSDREKQLDFLTTRLYAGYGAHGLFLKTIGAGLAYSNGIRGGVGLGRVGYYAERTPELTQTVRFVVNEIKNGATDPSLGEYAVAQAFSENRAAASYEARAENMAADIADKVSPETVRKFRQSILQLRKDPNLSTALLKRRDAVYARLLPGYAPKSSTPDSVYFVIGPDKQLDSWDQYLRSSEGGDSRLFKLYARDFWMP
jgi:Zn-dependent M16 (insulinase) family peptidase